MQTVKDFMLVECIEVSQVQPLMHVYHSSECVKHHIQAEGLNYFFPKCLNFVLIGLLID